VNESGTEAAAATAVGVGVVCLCTPQPIEFNRPFLFAIRERETGAILFIGRLGDPAAN
jgi:serpin B